MTHHSYGIRGSAILNLMVLGGIAVLGLSGVLGKAILDQRAELRAAEYQEAIFVSNVLKDALNCEGTYASAASAGILNASQLATGCSSTSDFNGQKPPYFQLQVNSLSGTKPLGSPIDADGVSRFGHLNIRVSCSQSEQSLIVRVARGNSKDFYGGHSLLVGRPNGAGFFEIPKVVAGVRTKENATQIKCPVKIPGVITQLTAGWANLCGIFNGDIWCRGNNESGQLGIGHSSRAEGAPVKAQASGGAEQIVVGNAACALKGGKVSCWGMNRWGETGRGTQGIALEFNPAPVLTAPGVELTGVTQIYSTGMGFCAVAASNNYCWGANYDSGYFGFPVFAAKTVTPNFLYATNAILTEPGAPLSAITKMTFGSADRNCALAGGAGYVWGGGLGGGLPNGGPPNSLRIGMYVGYLFTTPILNLESGVSDLFCGGSQICAIQGGNVKCLGADNYGQQGNGPSGGYQSTPQNVLKADGSPLTGGVSIATSYASACAVTNDGMVYCWGKNDKGQLGDGTKTNREFATPVKVTASQMLQGANKVVMGAEFSCATVMGDVYCWGDNSYFQIDSAKGNEVLYAWKTALGPPAGP